MCAVVGGTHTCKSPGNAAMPPLVAVTLPSASSLSPTRRPAAAAGEASATSSMSANARIPAPSSTGGLVCNACAGVCCAAWALLGCRSRCSWCRSCSIRAVTVLWSLLSTVRRPGGLYSQLVVKRTLPYQQSCCGACELLQRQHLHVGSPGVHDWCSFNHLNRTNDAPPGPPMALSCQCPCVGGLMCALQPRLPVHRVEPSTTAAARAKEPGLWIPWLRIQLLIVL